MKFWIDSPMNSNYFPISKILKRIVFDYQSYFCKHLNFQCISDGDILSVPLAMPLSYSTFRHFSTLLTLYFSNLKLLQKDHHLFRPVSYWVYVDFDLGAIMTSWIFFRSVISTLCYPDSFPTTRILKRMWFPIERT